MLQVLETQRVLPKHFEAWACHDGLHLRFLVDCDSAQAYRIGWLLRRLPVLTSAHWLAVDDEQDEQVRWHLTALASKAERESDVDLDPDSAWWHAAPSVTLLADNEGNRLPGHETEVRMQWTAANLYVLFDCAFQHLSLRAGKPLLLAPTPNLWEQDVAEVFLGADRESFQQYLEFEVSPRGEWIDLDITAFDGTVQHRAAAQSGFVSAARIDLDRRRWLAFFCLPLTGLRGEDGDDLRLNLFRSQGQGPVELAWQPTHQDSFHVPSSFGYLHLIDC